MAATLIRLEQPSRLARFVIDNADDLALLPTTKSAGKGNLATISYCAQGSVAEAVLEDNTYYRLSGGDTPVWKKKTGTLIGAGSGGIASDTGGSAEDLPDGISTATDGDIDDMFP